MTTTRAATAATSGDTFVLRYTQQIGELIHAARLYQRTTRKHQVYKVLGLLAIFGGSWLLLTSGLIGGPVLLLVLGVFLWFDPVPLLVIYGGFRGSAAVTQSYETALDARGTHFAIGKSRVKRPWDKYEALLESDQVFVLVYGRWAYSVIPKRALSGPEQVDSLRELLRANIRSG